MNTSVTSLSWPSRASRPVAWSLILRLHGSSTWTMVEHCHRLTLQRVRH
jgi:hypothetical protein